jgi:hypothetical protein
VHPIRSSASSPIRRNSTVTVSSQSTSDSSVTSGPPNSARTRDGSPPSPQKPILPPIESIASPSDQYPWGFSSSSLANSLRAGPLSCHACGSPAGGDAPLSFDPSSFRTATQGFRPRLPALLPMASSFFRKREKAQRASRSNGDDDERRRQTRHQASMTCLHHLPLSSPNQLHPNVHELHPMESRSVASHDHPLCCSLHFMSAFYVLTHCVHLFLARLLSSSETGNANPPCCCGNARAPPPNAGAPNPVARPMAGAGAFQSSIWWSSIRRDRVTVEVRATCNLRRALEH